MDLKINSNLIRRWQGEQQNQTGDAKLLPDKIATSHAIADNTSYIELGVSDVTRKKIGNIDGHRIADLVRKLR